MFCFVKLWIDHGSVEQRPWEKMSHVNITCDTVFWNWHIWEKLSRLTCQYNMWHCLLKLVNDRSQLFFNSLTHLRGCHANATCEAVLWNCWLLDWTGRQSARRRPLVQCKIWPNGHQGESQKPKTQVPRNTQVTRLWIWFSSLSGTLYTLVRLFHNEIVDPEGRSWSAL